MDNNIMYKNEKLNKILFSIIALVYNFTIGFFSFLIYLAIAWSMINYKNYIEVAVILIFMVLLIPLNIYIKKKLKINMIVYFILSVLAYILGYGFYIFIT